MLNFENNPSATMAAILLVSAVVINIKYRLKN